MKRLREEHPREITLGADVWQYIERWLDFSELKALRLVSRQLKQCIQRMVPLRFKLIIGSKLEACGLLTEVKAISVRDARTLQLFFHGKQPNIIDLSWRIADSIERDKFPNLTHLDVGSGFREEIDLRQWPQLTHLRLFGRCDDLDLTAVPNLCHLMLGYGFNEPLPLESLSHLTYLSLGQHFNQPLNLSCLPNLTHLRLGASFNQRLCFNDSQKLTHFAIVGSVCSYNFPLDFSQTPNLEELILTTLQYHHIIDIRLLYRLRKFRFKNFPSDRALSILCRVDQHEIINKRGD